MRIVRYFKKIYKKIIKYILRTHKNVIEEVFPKQQVITIQDNRSLMMTAEEITKKLLEIEGRVDDIYSTLKYSIDIEKLPKAKGYLRRLQLLMGFLLNDFNSICEENDINYWVNFGTLLGTVRHQGFVPWDDDLDVAMLAEDYNKFQKLNNNVFVSKGINKFSGSPRYFTKIQYIELVPHSMLALDIFPYYSSNINSSDLKERLNECVRELFAVPDILTNKTKWNDIIDKYKLNRITKVKPGDNIYPGLELISYTKPLFKLEDIFPLQTSLFEGHRIKIPHNFHKFLYESYGDYYDFPSKWLRTLHQREINLDDIKVRNIIDKLLIIKNDEN